MQKDGPTMSARDRLLKAFARFNAHFSKRPARRRRLRIPDAPSIVPDTI
jgi:hypothetical protein